jgi:hypothetical protein
MYRPPLEMPAFSNGLPRGLNPWLATAIGRDLEVWERKEAKARQKDGGSKGGKSNGKVRETFPEVRTRDRVGSALGISGKQYEKAKAAVAPHGRNKKRPTRPLVNRAGPEDTYCGRVYRFRRQPQAARGDEAEGGGEDEAGGLGDCNPCHAEAETLSRFVGAGIGSFDRSPRKRLT